tara:strand:+ start:1119 stop:1631 length:513 start_codon:yes stop_codon:yes gene_type:complete
MKKIIINAFGVDRPGIVSEVTKVITFFNGNIETSKMLQLESEFSLLMLIKVNKDKIDDLFNKLDQINDLKITGKITKEKTENSTFKYYKFSITIADNEGIVFIFSDLFKKYSINILNMETEVKNAPITGSPVFSLESTLMIPENIDLEKFKKDIDKAAEVESIDFSLKNS